MNTNTLLAICIPIFNRAEVFSYSFKSIVNSISLFNHFQSVEVIVSDNCSTDDIKGIVFKTIDEYPNVKIRYHRNNSNIGLARNFIKSVDLSNSKYSWIVGSDDFFYKNTISLIIDLLNNNSDLDFFTLAFQRLNLKKTNLDEISFCNNLETLKVGNVTFTDELIHPKYENVYLGSMMVNIFRTDIWKSFVIDNNKLDGFTNIYNIYPHVVIFANRFLRLKALHVYSKILIVGEGVREWSTDYGDSFWDSSFPIMFFNVLFEIAQLYRVNGLKAKIQKSIDSNNAKIVGIYFLPYLFAILTKKSTENLKKINKINIFKSFFHFSFYFGLYVYLSKKIKSLF
jgi:glycosyltransferase involved in cell wall biosynthesis